ncbi:cytochrome b [Thermasporomyces composti]|jgi:ubiquinol-cytochrome c reductase cytochrome b subunit|uniref:Cytochrome bc1 complex cytochrome b subunit n=1 Tax=Thermasporomyces composti TaxID=696763 RepID=A0A3D9V3W3_THECX|nr:ubiquinol-cytochrome c reductase cytochrome b subunit [Thermasporomyces composti]REF34900.1 menaquinol-cytochrome c reductase cytochrome b subunit precursor [Thermasporomyces composti]
MSSATPKAVTQPLEFLDERLGLAKALKKTLRKVFPDHWSFLLGEIALYSFIILLLSGTFLTLWFKPSMQEVVYDGSYGPLRGVHMSEAFASTLNISFDVRGGLLMRQIHHWSAMLFVGAMMVHMLRVFFTGAFRKPREINWLIGVVLLNLGLVEGFTGYSLPDDLLSGTGLRFVEGLIRSIPVVGTYLSFFVFGGEFPGDSIIPRLYGIHILLIPGLILALIAAHIGLVVYHKHTQYPGPGRTNNNVVGYPLLPVYMAKAGGFFFIVFGVTALMGALFQINPVWAYGPYNPTMVGAGTQPDWYMGWVEGGLRIMPNWETRLFGYTVSWNIFLPGVGLLGLLAVVLALYPFIERWVTGDTREHHVLDRPRNQPTRTAFGVAGITFYGLLWIGGGNDIIAITFNLAINDVTNFLRVAVIVGPIIAFLVTKRICIGLQRRDRESLLHGMESGVITRLPHGEYVEIHTPLPKEEAYVLASHERQTPIEIGEGVDANGVEIPKRRSLKLRALASRFYFGDVVQKPTKGELEAAHAHGRGHGAIHHDGADRTKEVGAGTQQRQSDS